MVDSKLEFAYLNLCLNKPELFSIKFKPTDPLVEWVFGIIDSYRGQFHRYPNLATFQEFVKTKCSKQQLTLIVDSLNTDIDSEFVLSTVIKFVKRQNIKQAIATATGYLANDEIEEAERVLIQSTELIYSPTLDYFNDTRGVKDYNFVPTGFKNLDRVLGGGIHWNNAGLIIGPKSSGKSLTMINLGVNATIAGHTVLHVSFEDSKDQIATRYDLRYTKVKQNPKKGLFIHVFPAGEASCADIEALVHAYKPRLVLVDYLNEMGWENRNLCKSEDLGARMRGLRALAERKSCSVWTAQQAGRSGKFSEEDLNAEDGFWSYEPAQVADIVATLNQTKEEKETGKIRLILDRHRNGRDGISFPFNIEYENMYLEETYRSL